MPNASLFSSGTNAMSCSSDGTFGRSASGINSCAFDEPGTANVTPGVSGYTCGQLKPQFGPGTLNQLAGCGNQSRPKVCAASGSARSAMATERRDARRDGMCMRAVGRWAGAVEIAAAGAECCTKLPVPAPRTVGILFAPDVDPERCFQ